MRKPISYKDSLVGINGRNSDWFSDRDVEMLSDEEFEEGTKNEKEEDIFYSVVKVKPEEMHLWT